MDPAAHIGAVHLTIADLARSIRFYESRLGFTLRVQDDRTAWLGAGGADLLILSQSEHAPRARGTTGLYHFAILTPSRANLARSLRRLVATRTPLTGASDHGVSEALYLNDPDGNGIEIYRDRPRREWPFVGGRVNMGLDPLDLAALLADAADDDGGLAEGTIIGHMHLRVARIDEAERFYVGVGRRRRAAAAGRRARPERVRRRSAGRPRRRCDCRAARVGDRVVRSRRRHAGGARSVTQRHQIPARRRGAAATRYLADTICHP